METIRPSSDLRNKYNEISKLCKNLKEPIYITVNGHGDTVLLNYDYFKQMTAELELLKMLAESEEDVAKERIAPISETFDLLRKKIK